MEFLKVENGRIRRGGEEFLLRGFGLGGWLLPEGYMWKFFTKCDRPRRIEALVETLCGKDYAQGFWQRYARAYVTEADIAWIARNGFNSVRLPLNARHLFRVDGKKVEFSPPVLALVDDCVRWCRRHGVYVVLDMHAAPGGQTGQNIDDSEADRPELFTAQANEDLLVEMWRLLAQRYAGEPAVAGYDLLNEPLPKWNAQHNHRLLPLYRRVTAAIRQVDQRHLIILEGAHWATDFSVFDGLAPEEAAREQIVLQFHKYWNCPDEDSLRPFLDQARRLNAPLYLGESGENNLAWYTTVFPLCERLGIGWCFWSYKKMDNRNSPVTFAQPEGWAELLAYLDTGAPVERGRAQRIFDAFLNCVEQPVRCDEVMRALSRTAPLEIPAHACDACRVRSRREEGAELRQSEPLTLLFADGHKGEPDFKRYDGGPQPDSETLLLRLLPGDEADYRFTCKGPVVCKAALRGEGTVRLSCSGRQAEFPVPGKAELAIPEPGSHTLTAACADGRILLEKLEFEEAAVRA